ncbi:hypothetical protein PACTADRAFT_48972 [Pachysolen tannophilus NRRL Y-2460]|uniref:Small ribosomal subunit protein mS29 n=1 Tax=Pachysolen tannophilus NRRL Y-2460 TaxID=669874 RepID=A0A1E4TZN9_PACTA|nr:hypothetical protein PACTADRAFT_48972 [Pachysolen tannophilus NRRL Y-2460]
MLRSGLEPVIVRQPRLFGRAISTRVNPVLAENEKKLKLSFRKVNSNAGGKKRKGSGNHKSFKDLIIASNFKQYAKQTEGGQTLINELLPFIDSQQDFKIDEILSYPNQSLKSLYHFGSFNHNQYNEINFKPVSLSRNSTTVPILNFLKNSLNNCSINNRLIITGGKGVGKSTLLTQFQSLAKSSNSIILPISYCDSLIDGSNDFIYDQTLKLYHQPMYLTRLLNKIRKGNELELSLLKLSKDVKISNIIFEANKTSLNEFLLKSKSMKLEFKFKFFEILIEELSLQKKYPVYLTVDNFSAFASSPFTKYRNVNNKPIYFTDFSIAKNIIDFASGKKIFNRGGIVLSTSGIHRSNDTLNVALKKIEPDPYAPFYKFDPKLASILLENNGLKELNVPKFNKDELKIMLNYFCTNEIIEHENDLQDIEKLLNSKYILSGNGNPSEFIKSCVVNYH